MQGRPARRLSAWRRSQRQRGEPGGRDAGRPCMARISADRDPHLIAGLTAPDVGAVR